MAIAAKRSGRTLIIPAVGLVGLVGFIFPTCGNCQNKRDDIFCV